MTRVVYRWIIKQKINILIVIVFIYIAPLKTVFTNLQKAENQKDNNYRLNTQQSTKHKEV